MRCIKCNYDNLDGLQYCVNCGSPLMTMEEKQNQEMQKQNKLKILYVLSGILIFVLIVMVVLLLLGVGFGTEKESGKDSKENHVEKATVGNWKCNTDSKLLGKKQYTIVFDLKEDGTYKLSNYGQEDKNYSSGTFSSNSLGKKDDSNIYNLYSFTFTQEKIITNGKTTEEKDEVPFTGGVTDEGTGAIFNNSKTRVTYYCVN